MKSLYPLLQKVYFNILFTQLTVFWVQLWFQSIFRLNYWLLFVLYFIIIIDFQLLRHYFSYIYFLFLFLNYLKMYSFFEKIKLKFVWIYGNISIFLNFESMTKSMTKSIEFQLVSNKHKFWLKILKEKYNWIERMSNFEPDCILQLHILCNYYTKLNFSIVISIEECLRFGHKSLKN